MTAKKTLKVGIAGYGVVGRRRRNFIDQHPACRTIAVCDQKFSSAATMPDDIKYFTKYDRLLNEPLDILFVCMPNYLAADVTIAGLSKGLHVFCEKPPGRDVADIRRVIEAEKKNLTLRLKYGFNHRYHDSVRKALAMIRSGELGEVVNLRGVYGKSKVFIKGGEWRAERKSAGGGILLDQGIHMVDLIGLFCGYFKEVKSYVQNGYWNREVEDNAYAIMRDEKGRVAMLHSSATQWQHRFTLDITLTQGYLELQGILSGTKSYGEERLIIGRRSESDNGTMQEDTITYLEDTSWRDEINEFVDDILNGRKIVNGTSREALATMELVYRIYYSDEQWREKNTIENPDTI